MLRLQVSTEDLFHSRFAVSPLFELGCLLRSLAGRSHRPLPIGWADRLAPIYQELREQPAIRAITALQTASYGAGFIAPPPSGLATTIADDLAMVRSTSPEQARRDIERCLDMQPEAETEVETFLAQEDVVARLADALHTAWNRLLAADWVMLRTICERDVVRRAEQLGRHGWASALDDLGPKVRWNVDAIEFREFPEDHTYVVGGTGLIFVPSVLIWPNIAVHVGEPWPKTVIYPASGISLLWEKAEANKSSALYELLGRTRGRILAALTSPATTTQLARSLSVSAGAVGDHLSVLRRSGLVTCSRYGRSVLYRQTTLGRQLIKAPNGDSL